MNVWKKWSIQLARTKNAVRHGGYSRSVVLPWENADEFSKLHEEMQADLGPDGPMHEEVVHSIAVLMWRKRRLATGALLEFGHEPNGVAFLAAAKDGEDGIAKYVKERLGHHDRIRHNLREASAFYNESLEKLVGAASKALAGQIEISQFEDLRPLPSEIIKLEPASLFH
jgi:hypothetical protein